MASLADKNQLEKNNTITPAMTEAINQDDGETNEFGIRMTRCAQYARENTLTYFKANASG